MVAGISCNLWDTRRAGFLELAPLGLDADVSRSARAPLVVSAPLGNDFICLRTTRGSTGRIAQCIGRRCSDWRILYIMTAGRQPHGLP